MSTTKTGEIVKKADVHANARALVTKMSGEIAKALPRHLTPERMARVVMTALTKTPKLAECTQASFAGAILTASQLGLEPNTPLGECYLIPYGTECTLLIGYAGMMSLARRSGEVSSIYAHAVRDGDTFDYELGLDMKLTHKPSNAPDREAKAITHAYAVAKMKDGERIFTVLSIAQVESRRARSRASKSGPWVTDYEAMVLKTAVRALFKWLPKSIEMATAESIEVAQERGESTPIDIDTRTQNALLAQGIVLETTASGDTYDASAGEISPEEEQRMEKETAQ